VGNGDVIDGGGDGDEEMQHEEVQHEGEEEQPALKRRRIEGSGEQQQQVVSEDGQQVPGDRVPFFKAGLGDPDDKAENDCFFDSCTTRAGGNQYIM